MYRVPAVSFSRSIRLAHNAATAAKAAQTKVSTAKLQTKERQEAIVSNISKFYPSMSALPGNPSAYKRISIGQFLETYAAGPQVLQSDLPDVPILLNGRIANIRTAGKKMCFIDLVNSETGQKVQVIVNYNKLHEAMRPEQQQYISDVGFLRKGDYIQVRGHPGVSENAQRTVSLKCKEVPIMLSPIQQPLPNGLVDNTKINKNRVLDYQVNGVRDLVLRSQVIALTRQFLTEQRYMEVETPMLSSKSNGANAMPFQTKLNFNDTALELRISPELWLKRLIISGLDRVFEIGKVFRNEGVDSTHNPEFTMMECYQTYMTMEDLILFSENLFKFILTHMVQHTGEGPVRELYNVLAANDWKFKRVEFLPALSEGMNVDFSKVNLTNVDSLMAVIPDSIKQELFSGLELSAPNQHLSPQKVLDKLCGKYIEDVHCQSLLPTIILHHPVVMSPLSKVNSDDSTITQRFEVFINGQEYINAYEEENCPQVQLEKFEAQNKYKESDNESLNVDYQYVETMKSGMPPTGGLGLGIDRLCMLLLGKTRIEQVLAFGSLDDVNAQ
ncbi:lysine--tRNA ligase [Maudiozyma humilis]|uniref:lysine--tRNA ligase n=1 Tax=Maudiozyma humilis TaxID=51915 RepID=A0AAV5RRF9_MAUHU|nr:lysine--tRNA ligase [Kazachstania humilis]